MLVENFGNNSICISALIACICPGLVGHRANYLQQSQSKDPSEVVIDELIGQWIAVLPDCVSSFFT